MEHVVSCNYSDDMLVRFYRRKTFKMCVGLNIYIHIKISIL